MKDITPDNASQKEEVQNGNAISPKPRKTFLLWGIAGVAALLLAAGIPTGLWIADRVSAQAAAQEDADALLAAIESAEIASDDFDTTVNIASTHTDMAVIPVREKIGSSTAEFGQEHLDALTETLESLAAALTPPLPPATAANPIENSPEEQDPDEESIDTENTVGSEEPQTDEVPDPWLIILEYLSGEDIDLAAALEEHYLELSSEERVLARESVTKESNRFQIIKATFDKASAQLRQAVETSDEIMQAAVESAITQGPETIESLEHSSEESIADFQAALTSLEPLLDITLPVSWDTRTLEQPSALGSISESIDSFVGAASSARDSHAENTPRSSGGGSGGYLCYRWSAWGTYLAWCY